MRPSLIPSLLLLLVTIVTFWPARSAPFVGYDDPVHVTENPFILPPSPARLAYFWRYPLDRSPVPGVPSTAGKVQPPYREIYSPLAFTTWGLLVYPARTAAPANATAEQGAPAQKITLDPAVYHTFNLGLHLINVLLVFALLRRFVPNPWAAALGTAIFAIHPVQVEPVTWVTGMNNLLSGFFALMALLLYLHNRGQEPRWKDGVYWCSTLCFLLAILSKPSSVTLPALVLLLAWALHERNWRARWLEMIPWAGIALFCVGMNALVAAGNNADLKTLFWQRPFLVGDALTFYVSKLLFPWNLIPDYGRRPEWVMQQPLTYFVWLLPIGISVLVWRWWRGSLLEGRESRVARVALFCLAFFAVVLLPSSGIVSYYFHRISTVSDRYMYMALIGPAVLTAVMAARCFESKNVLGRRLFALCILALVTTASLSSFQQTKLWCDELQLWSRNIALNPQSTIAYGLYGTVLDDRQNYPAAIAAFERGLSVNPQSAILELGLANAYFHAHDYARAQLHYQKSLQLSPTGVDTHLNLGILLLALGKTDEAIEHFKQGLQLQPESPSLLSYMGLALIQSGRSAEAAVWITKALKCGFDPANGHVYLGNALAQGGNIPAATREWSLALQFDPRNYEANYNLGIAAAGMGNAQQAVPFFERAIEIQPHDAPALAQLGLQWQKLGQMERARAAFKSALQSDPQNVLALTALKQLK